jgi:hypothetical protein
LPQSLEHKFQWKRALAFGKALHLIITDGAVAKTLCGHNVSDYKLKANTFGKKCGLCQNIEKQHTDIAERFDTIDNMPSHFNSGRYS